MRKLTNEIIAEMVKEEIAKMIAEFDFSPYKGQSEGDDTLSVGLDVTHKGTGMDYTIKSIGMDDIELATPEGDRIVCTKDQLKKDYDIGVDHDGKKDKEKKGEEN